MNMYPEIKCLFFFFFFLIRKVLMIFLFQHETICCRYSLEVLHQGNICFNAEIREILCRYLLVFGAMHAYLLDKYLHPKTSEFILQ